MRAWSRFTLRGWCRIHAVDLRAIIFRPPSAATIASPRLARYVTKNARDNRSRMRAARRRRRCGECGSSHLLITIAGSAWQVRDDGIISIARELTCRDGNNVMPAGERASWRYCWTACRHGERGSVGCLRRRMTFNWSPVHWQMAIVPQVWHCTSALL